MPHQLVRKAQPACPQAIHVFHGERIRLAQQKYHNTQKHLALAYQLADAYRARKGLLPGEEIKSLRKSRQLTQQQLTEI